MLRDACNTDEVPLIENGEPDWMEEPDWDEEPDYCDQSTFPSYFIWSRTHLRNDYVFGFEFLLFVLVINLGRLCGGFTNLPTLLAGIDPVFAGPMNSAWLTFSLHHTNLHTVCHDDIPERVAQVVIMKDIYSSAIEAITRVRSPSRSIGSSTAIALIQGHNRVVQKAGAKLPSA